MDNNNKRPVGNGNKGRKVVNAKNTKEKQFTKIIGVL